MPKFIATAIRGLVQSDIRAMTRECNRVGGINLGQGVCRLPIEPEIIDAASAAIHGGGGMNSYTLAEGIPQLRERIARKLLRHNQITADPTTEIVVTAGTTAAYTSTLVALLERGDGILFLEPFYGYHVGVAAILGFVPQFAELAAPDFRLSEAVLRSGIDERTRAIALCTPSNPTGRMLDETELAAVAAVAEEHDLLLITDEIYEYIRYEGRRHISPASVYGLWARTVSIMGLSKTYSVTGWRLGYAVTRAEMAHAISLVHDLCYICAPAPLQEAAVTALDLPDSYYSRLAASYQERRDRMCEALSEAGLSPIVPEGSYFVLASIAHLGFRDSREAAMTLLETAGVASVPGTAFFRRSAGNDLLRFCFAVEQHELDEACRRLRAVRLEARSFS